MGASGLDVSFASNSPSTCFPVRLRFKVYRQIISNFNLNSSLSLLIINGRKNHLLFPKSANSIRTRIRIVTRKSSLRDDTDVVRVA